MSSNQKAVKENYKDMQEENRAAVSAYSALEFHYTKKHLSEFILSDSRVLELGCGTGYYALYFADKCREYCGVDITPENIELMNKKLVSSGLKNVSAKVGDATNLYDIPDNSFDAVLCLGPMYHLSPDERKLAFAECNRICKRGAIAAFAYINRVGVYAGACIHDRLRENYPNEKANELVLKNSTDDLMPDLFYFTMPEEIEAAAAAQGFEKIKNLGTDFFITASIVDSMSDEKLEMLKPLLDEMTSHASCTGMSNHALLICRKL